MTRQVRLDEDVAAMVEATADGYSLTAATNRVLRRVLTTATPPALLSPETPDDTRDGQTARRSDPGASREASTTRSGANTRSMVRRARTFSGGCTHPLARRYGDRCAGCGATIRA